MEIEINSSLFNSNDITVNSGNNDGDYNSNINNNSSNNNNNNYSNTYLFACFYKCFLPNCSPDQQVKSQGMKSICYILNRFCLAECSSQGRSACLGRKCKCEMLVFWVFLIADNQIFFLHWLAFGVFFSTFFLRSCLDEYSSVSELLRLLITTIP